MENAEKYFKKRNRITEMSKREARKRWFSIIIILVMIAMSALGTYSRHMVRNERFDVDDLGDITVLSSSYSYNNIMNLTLHKKGRVSESSGEAIYYRVYKKGKIQVIEICKEEGIPAYLSEPINICVDDDCVFIAIKQTYGKQEVRLVRSADYDNRTYWSNVIRLHDKIGYTLLNTFPILSWLP